MPATVQTQARQGLSSRRALFLLSISILLAMSLWFTGTAVIPQITTLWHSGLALGSWLTIAVQIGFSIGAITFALFNIPDVFSPIKVLVVSAVAAAAANAAFAFAAAQPLPAILLARRDWLFSGRRLSRGHEDYCRLVPARTRPCSGHHDRRSHGWLGRAACGERAGPRAVARRGACWAARRRCWAR